jgi:type II secretory pathway component GspD/PulD (secretin)
VVSRKETPKEMRIVRLAHARADAVRDMIASLMDDARSGDLRITTDERTNRVLLNGSPERLEEAIEFIRMLDEPGPEPANKSAGDPFGAPPVRK